MMKTKRDETRTLVLVDVENLYGGTRFSAADVTVLRHSAEATVDLPPNAHVVIATSCGTALVEAGLGWPGARRVWLPGHDGADLALADVALNEDAHQHYGRVIICSGDGLFAVVARYLVDQGLHVSVIARAGALSRQLATIAHDVHLLDNTLGRAA